MTTRTPTSAVAGEQRRGTVDMPPDNDATRTRLRRVRWAVRATLLLGVAASVAANILHADDNPVSQMIAAWPPLALLLTVELISRVPVHHRVLAVARLAATVTISGIAAWVSYWHMAGVAARYGEAGASPYLLPLSVDGLVIVASISLVELAGRIHTAEQAPTRDLDGSSAVLDTAPAHPALPSTPGTDAGAAADGVRPRPAAPATPAAPTTGKDDDEQLDLERLLAVEHDSNGNPAPRAAKQRRDTGDGDRDDEHHADAPPMTTTAEAVAYWRHKDPSLQPAEIAEKIGRSARTVFRYWASGQKPSRTSRSGNDRKDVDLALTAISDRR